METNHMKVIHKGTGEVILSGVTGQMNFAHIRISKDGEEVGRIMDGQLWLKPDDGGEWGHYCDENDIQLVFEP